MALGILIYLLYVYAFGEGSSVFYLFAFVMLLCCPLVGGAATFYRARKGNESRAHKKSFVSGAVIFTILIALAFFSYVILPVFFFERAQVPGSCMNNPPSMEYTVPGLGMGILLASDSRSSVLVLVDRSKPLFNSTVFLVNKSNNESIMNMKFNNDVIGAGISDGTLYLFNDRLGYFIDTANGQYVRNVIETDNYRGLYASGNTTYMQTNMELSAVNVNGSVISHMILHFASLVYGCFFQ